MYLFFPHRGDLESPPPPETSLLQTELVFPPVCSLEPFISKFPLRQWLYRIASPCAQLLWSYPYIGWKGWCLSHLGVSVAYRKAWDKQTSFPWMLNEKVVCFLSTSHFLSFFLFLGRAIWGGDACSLSTMLVLMLKCPTRSPQKPDALSADVISRNQIHPAHQNVTTLPQAQLIGQFCHLVFTQMCFV